MARELGERQKSMLDAMRRHGGVWYPGSGYTWDNRSTTVQIMDSLVNRGLVVKEMRKDGIGRDYPYYRLKV